ncbi:3-beta hydroxysteroid dehydrogenase/isomerase family protein [Rhizoctonia solani AG-3 Rhs1AP]|uniref:3-beta hydroxysteroid dehydrogenase/isomerase family protein n=1 Tax=Rhizoctonia solani AG-3 Rhs1AP TaxID=1086054 RepID=X8JBH1_9AGAM|nr:3-beta hydroxysteroid dehydrogenase/isomerase family protein [Rhizoctonia solani AG-3 Rhs1AP]
MDTRSEKPIIAVCGATGFQGGSTVRHLLRDGRFAIRGLTRKPESANAKGLVAQGVQVVRADFDDVDSMIAAFKGCHGVFGVTDYFDAFERETQQGINIVDAAKAAGVKHMIFSSGAENDPPVLILESKARVAAYLRASSIPWTVFTTSLYYTTLTLFDAFTRDPRTGGWRFYLPFPTDIPMASVSPRDIGAYITAAFTNPNEWIGKDMNIANEYITPRGFAEAFADVTCSHVEITEVTREEFLAMENKPFILQAWGTFRWFIDQHDKNQPFYDVQLAKRLCPDNQSFRDFVKDHMEQPPEQPLTIQCYRTQERFSDSAVAS